MAQGNVSWCAVVESCDVVRCDVSLDLPKEIEHDVEREHVRLYAYWRMLGRCSLSPVLVQMWQPSPGADVAGVGPIPVQMWPGRAQSRCGCGRGEPSPE